MIGLIIWLVICFAWLLYETDFMRVRLLRSDCDDTPQLTDIEFEAVREVLHVKAFANGNVNLYHSMISDMANGVSIELGNRSMPFHGRAHNDYPDKTARDLDVILKVYQCFQL